MSTCVCAWSETAPLLFVDTSGLAFGREAVSTFGPFTSVLWAAWHLDRGRGRALHLFRGLATGSLGSWPGRDPCMFAGLVQSSWHGHANGRAAACSTFLLQGHISWLSIIGHRNQRCTKASDSRSRCPFLCMLQRCTAVQICGLASLLAAAAVQCANLLASSYWATWQPGRHGHH